MVDRNPSSKWDEPTEIEGLTSYDRSRTIRKVPESQLKLSSIEIPYEVISSLLKENFQCSVCLGILETTLATTCLHRFCSECLHRSLRMELGPKMHHECPSCRAKLASRRASKADSKFDKLVQIFSGNKRSADDMLEPVSGMRGSSSTSPRANNTNQTAELTIDMKKYRDMHKDNVGKFREMRAQKLLNPSVRNSQTASANSRKAMNAAYSGYEGAASSSSANKKSSAKASANNAASAVTVDAQNKVWLKLIPTPEWTPDESVRNMQYNTAALRPASSGAGAGPAHKSSSGTSTSMELSHPFLRVPPYKTVLSLKAYLLQKFSFSSEAVSVDIFRSQKNKLTVLDDALSVLDMTTKNWDARSELVLYFQLRAK